MQVFCLRKRCELILPASQMQQMWSWPFFDFRSSRGINVGKYECKWFIFNFPRLNSWFEWLYSLLNESGGKNSEKSLKKIETFFVEELIKTKWCKTKLPFLFEFISGQSSAQNVNFRRSSKYPSLTIYFLSARYKFFFQSCVTENVILMHLTYVFIYIYFWIFLYPVVLIGGLWPYVNKLPQDLGSNIIQHLGKTFDKRNLTHANLVVFWKIWITLKTFLCLIS